MHYGSFHEDEVGGKVLDTALLRRFVRYVMPYRREVVFVLLLLPLVSLVKVAEPYVIKSAIDNHITKGDITGLPLVALLYLGLLLADSLLMYGEVYLLQKLGQQVMYDLRQELFTHVQRLAPSFFDRTTTGSMVTRLTGDVEVLGEMFAAGIITVVGDILMLAGIVGIMMWMNLRLSLATFAVMPLLIFIVFRFRRNMRTAFRQVRARLSDLNSFLGETIGGMAVVQLFRREKQEHENFRRYNSAYRDANLPVITWDAALFAAVEALSSVAVGIVIWYGGGEIVRNTLTFGELVAFIQYIDRFFGPIRDLSGKYSIMQGAMAALERIYQLLDSREVIPEPAAGKEPGALETLEFRNVTFGYAEGTPVLRDFSLTLRRGEKVALVGETGGGKTTVTRLLSRLYDIRDGEILLNGVDIREMPLHALRRRIGIVLQDPYLFTGSIGFNISLGDPSAAARMEEAARTVGADRFIDRLPHRFDEPVRERGSNFSAGERQLISFARAVAFDPEILVLDEATSSVDSMSERLVQEGLQGLMAGRTTLVVAHRLSTIRDADRIVVIHRGEKREEGTHAQLMELRGLYYRLYQLQFREGTV